MKHNELDKKLIAACPDTYAGDSHFTDRVMARLTSNEILSSSIRTMDVTKKETFIMKVKHMPAFAVVAIIIASLMIISGGAYAAYQLLWPKPHVSISEPTDSANGRKEFAISLAQCGTRDLAPQYELKKNAPIDTKDVPMVIQAHCEIDAITDWADKTFPHDTVPRTPTTNEEYDETSLSTSMATHIKSQEGSSITFTGVSKYGEKDARFQINPTTRFIADGHDVEASAITKEDAVVYITSDVSRMIPDCNNQHCSVASTSSTKTLLAVVKLSLPIHYYDQHAWQSLAERNPCTGNTADSCVSGGAIDLYMGGTAHVPGVRKEIQGVITQMNGSTVSIRSTSGTLFTITTPNDVIAEYNTNRASQNYNNQMIKEGSSLVVNYVEQPELHSKAIAADHLISVQLQLEVVSKNDPIKSY